MLKIHRFCRTEILVPPYRPKECEDDNHNSRNKADEQVGACVIDGPFDSVGVLLVNHLVESTE